MNHLTAELRQHPYLFAAGVLGFVASLLLLLCSKGTNDIETWTFFAREIKAHGLFELYRSTPQFNHPPLMGLFAWIALELASALGLSFAFVFKLFPVLANLAAALVLWRIWTHRADARRGVLAFALFSWALCPLFVAAYHGNTDCAAAFFCLWSVYFLEVQKRPFLGGLALAAAINIKIIPLLIALPALAGCRSAREARLFALGSATAALPFLMGLLGAGTFFVRNVFGYASAPETWGVQMLLESLRTLPGMTSETMAAVHDWYFVNGKYLLILAILALSGYGAWRRIGHARLMAAALVLFLVLSPGFGIQYTAYPAPLLFAVSLARGSGYSLVAGVYVGLVYASWSEPVFPLESSYDGFPPSLGFMGFATWLAALTFLPECLRSRSVRSCDTPGPEREPVLEATAEAG